MATNQAFSIADYPSDSSLPRENDACPMKVRFAARWEPLL
jgi:hypothetical protein